MFKTQVEYICSPLSTHAGTSRVLHYSFLTETRAKEFVGKVNAMKQSVDGPKAVAKFIGENLNV